MAVFRDITLRASSLAVSVLERSPEVPARDRRVRAPLLADAENVLRRRTLLEAIRALDGILHAEVELGEHVRTAEPEHEEHLHRPSPDPLHLHEVLDDLV